MTAPCYMTAFDPRELLNEFPIGDSFEAAYARMRRDELRRRQDRMFLSCIDRAWKTPFYQELWGRHGIEAGDICSLDDLPSLPVFDKSDIMASIERSPPFGDFHARDSYPEDERPPIIIHTTSGTTGKPQIIPFGPRGREVQNLMLARTYRLQGMRDSDVVHSVYGYGMINGGHFIREAVTHWTGATLIPAGTGLETRSAQQVQLIRDFGATVLVGFADYLKHLARMARENGIDPDRDLKIRMISGHLGMEDRDALSQAWNGCAVYDWYGVADTGTIAGEGPDRDGLYVMEDAHFVEILDTEDRTPVAPGGVGDMVVTVLFKNDIYPMIRFNTHDLSRWRSGEGLLGSCFRRIDGFLGRSDNMIKIKGVNVFPHAIGAMLKPVEAFAGEYICELRRGDDGRDSLTVRVEVRVDPSDAGFLAQVKEVLRRATGIDVQVVLEKPDALKPLTEIETRQKPIRLLVWR